VAVQLEATNRRVDLIAEGIDVAIRVRPPPIEASDLMMKILAQRGNALVASPELAEKAEAIRVPADFSLPSLDLGPPRQEHVWKLEGPNGAEAIIHHRPRLVSDDMIALRSAAIAGVGVVPLPLIMVSDEIRNGSRSRQPLRHQSAIAELTRRSKDVTVSTSSANLAKNRFPGAKH
jgi:DNA-binding transcriptional LysR family regulator